ncbi:MAG TPA: SufD family Fe-S cluster assembly protein [Candidatus Limnocylindria bacterium]|nr:SufD family Fe-S cluster assembly protein [Candidatus Limnocylindria bacterium]
MTVQTGAALDAATVEHVSEGEPAWLAQLRAGWWRRVEANPWPTGAEEEWRRTSLDGLPRDGGLLLDAPVATYDLDPQLAARGVIFGDLATAVREHGDLLKAHLGRHDTLSAQMPFWGRSLAAWTGGTCLYVPRGVTIDGPLTARTTLPSGAYTYLPHTLVVLEEDASATLLEEISSPDGEAVWFGGTAELQVGYGARLRYANLQRLGDGVWRIGAQRVEVGQDANVTTLNAEIGSAISKVGMDVRMTGKGGTSRLLGLLAAGGAQSIDFNSCQDLLGSHTTSDLLYLSALYDESHASFYGVTRVRPEAKQTSSYQECRNLLLSPKAGAEPIPVLEIETNDILRCGHGATAGAIDPVQRFYAQSRGMSADAAERMIVRGFFERVVAQIDSEPIKARVLDALVPRIGRTDEEAAA